MAVDVFIKGSRFCVPYFRLAWQCMPRTGRTYYCIIRVLFALTVFLLASLSTFNLSESSSADSDPAVDTDLMVVRYACMGCSGQCPMYFTEYADATRHWSRSSACNLSGRGIATVVLPNRPGDAEAGGTGAAAKWQGQGLPGPSRRAGLIGRSSGTSLY